ncbi:MAG: FG-GAP repeat protein [Gaiellaceae bacterium]
MAVLAALLVALVAPAVAQGGETSRAAGAGVRADFNGDGFADLAVGVPFEDVGSVLNAGAVNVIYGSGNGLSAGAGPDQFWSQNSPSVNDTAEQDDRFGSSLATLR